MLEKNANENMIEIVKTIAHDYEHGFGKTKDEKASEEYGYLVLSLCSYEFIDRII